MSSFKLALKWLKEGKKVTRPCWDLGSYWNLGNNETILWCEKKTAHIHLQQIEAKDWEIYTTKK